MTGMYMNGRREGHWIISRRKGIMYNIITKLLVEEATI